jgi:hypothetical protein
MGAGAAKILGSGVISGTIGTEGHVVDNKVEGATDGIKVVLVTGGAVIGAVVVLTT